MYKYTSDIDQKVKVFIFPGVDMLPRTDEFLNYYNLPKDGVMVNCGYNKTHNGMCLQITHDSFPLVKKGGKVEEVISSLDPLPNFVFTVSRLKRGNGG